MTIKTNDLVKGLRTVSQVMQRYNSIPILSSALVSSTADEVTLTSTDMDIRVDVSFPGQVKGDDITIPNPGQIANMLAKIGEDETKIQVVKDGENVSGVRVFSGLMDMDMDSLPAKDFPDGMKLIDEEWSADVGSDFVSALKQVRAAISTEETRYYLNGVYLDTKGSNWDYALVATNGHQLYNKGITIPSDTRLADSQSAIIPRKVVQLILTLFDGKLNDAPLKISFGKKKLVNEQGSETVNGTAPYFRVVGMLGEHKITITAKTIDGSFPDYRRVIPKEDQIKFRWSYSVADLHRAMRAFAAFRGRHATAVKFQMASDLTTLTAQWAEFGKMRMKVKHEGEAQFEIGFNSRYLLEMLDAHGGAEKVMFCGSDAVSPVIVRNDKDPSFLTVLMPMRV